jgi:mannose-6-phosphate isomerase
VRSRADFSLATFRTIPKPGLIAPQFGGQRWPTGASRDFDAPCDRGDAVPFENQARIMAIEHARARALPKPWGVVDRRPWSDAGDDGSAVGEIWFERSNNATVEPSLLLKLLFTSQPLSIQVHPDDTFAHSMGLPCGKTEAWHILNASPGSQVALGLHELVSPQQLREGIDDGSISDLIVWRSVSSGETIFVPAGTIHAIGAGLVIAELQQRSDATFRLFDYDRGRDLQVENAIAVANAGPAKFQVDSIKLTAERTLLISSPHFVFERVELAPETTWCLEAERETWLLIIGGDGIAGSFDVGTGDCIFAQSDHVDIRVGCGGMVGLVAYAAGGLVPHLLQRVTQPHAVDGVPLLPEPVPILLPQATRTTAMNQHIDLAR